MKNMQLIAASILASLLTAGCTSQTTSQTHYSGFLSSYTDLEKAKTPSGNTVLRRVDPNFDVANYSGLLYRPVSFYPQPKPSEQISAQTLQQVLDHTNRVLSGAFSKRLPLVQNAGPGTLIFRGAITGVNTSNEGLQFYEVIPVALVVAGTMAATGHRDQNTELFLEGEFIDANTGKPVVEVVRKGFGAVLDNDKQQVTVDDLKSIIDDMAVDIARFP
jgi:hypothetical protein